MAKKPNYRFERQERERIKKQKNDERALAKLGPASTDDIDSGANSLPAKEED